MLKPITIDQTHQKTMGKQHQEIQERLDRYCDLFLNVVDEETDTSGEFSIDIFKELALLQDSLKNQKADLCFCERENICCCVSSFECECDVEDFHMVSGVEIIEGSNSNLIFEFLTLERVAIPRLKNVRFFALDKETDDETWIMDLLKVVEKRKKKKVVSKYFLKTKTRCNEDEPKYIHYEIFDVPHLQGKRIQIKIDYLQYHLEPSLK